MGDFWEVAMNFLSVVLRGGLRGVKLCIYHRAKHAHRWPLAISISAQTKY
jgi:hypothetical protein